MRGHLCWAVVLALATGCQRGASEQPASAAEQPAAAADPVIPMSPPPPEFPAERRCGEAGREPTVLPPVLADGLPVLGRATLRPGETKSIGAVSFEYSEREWIGPNVEHGQWGAAVNVLIPQAEANGAAWGHQLDIHPGQKGRFDLGPYQIETSMTKSEPVELSASVRRNDCPKHAEIEATDEPRSLWVSTDAIALQTFDLQGAMLQVAVMDIAGAPTVQVSNLGFNHRITAVPGTVHTLRVNTRIVTIDEIVAGSEPNRVHARARIELAPPAVATEPVTASGCGDPSPVRTQLPSTLALPVPIVDELHMAPGEKAKTAKLELELTTVPDELPGDFQLAIGGPEPATPSSLWISGTRTQLARSGRTLLRVDPSEDGELRVRRLQLACAPELTLPRVTAPTTLWLSTHGLVAVTIEAPTRLRLQAYAEIDQPGIGAETEHAYWIASPLQPTATGNAFTLDGWLVEILDIATSGDTHFEDHRWLGTAALPGVHVQVRITPPA